METPTGRSPLIGDAVNKGFTCTKKDSLKRSFDGQLNSLTYYLLFDSGVSNLGQITSRIIRIPFPI